MVTSPTFLNNSCKIRPNSHTGALLSPFFGEGFSTKIDYRNKKTQKTTTWYPYSNLKQLEDLDLGLVLSSGNPPQHPLAIRRRSTSAAWRGCSTSWTPPGMGRCPGRSSNKPWRTPQIESRGRVDFLTRGDRVGAKWLRGYWSNA